MDNTATDRRFYVYAYLREDGTPYYIGKGLGRRAWSAHKRGGVDLRPTNKAQIVVLATDLTEDQAFAWERDLIELLRDVSRLENKTSGGQGCSNPSAETRAKIGAANKGIKRTESTRAKIKAARAKQVITEAHRAAISKAGKGRKLSDAHRKALSESADSATKAAAARAGWKKSPNHGAAISKGKLQPQVWHHPDHGTVVAPAKEIMQRFDVANLSAVKRGVIKQSKGWTWVSAA